MLLFLTTICIYLCLSYATAKYAKKKNKNQAPDRVGPEKVRYKVIGVEMKGMESIS